jgi:hypothetical protein
VRLVQSVKAVFVALISRFSGFPRPSVATVDGRLGREARVMLGQFNSGGKMEQELPTKLIAERVVELLSEKNSDSLKEALAMLEAFFANQPDRVARAYELAWVVVLKRSLSKKSKLPVSKPAPEADWLALRASKAIDAGNITQAFSLLRTANSTGARTTLCRSVVFQMIRQVEKKDRITHVNFEGTKFGTQSVTTLEIARVKGSGLVVIRNPGSKYDLKKKGWREEEGRDPYDAGRIFIKSLEDLKLDVAKGMIEYSMIGRKRGEDFDPFERIDWSKYVRELCENKRMEQMRESA